MSHTVPTVKVKPWGEGQGDFVEINEADFDAAIHELHEGAAPSGLESMTVADLKAHAEGNAIDIGDATKKADIIAAIELAAEPK